MRTRQNKANWLDRLKSASLELEIEAADCEGADIEKTDNERADKEAGNRDGQTLIPAAVLLAFHPGKDGVNLVLTRRTAHLPTHKGEIALPGGKAIHADKDRVATALRETHEEIGVEVDKISVIGQLPPHPTGSGFLITPITAWLTPPIRFKKQQSEVAEIFEMPLDHLSNPKNYQRQTVVIAGEPRKFWILPYKNYKIWGATAAILIDLANRLSKARV